MAPAGGPEPDRRSRMISRLAFVSLAAALALIPVRPGAAEELGEGVQEVRDCAEKNMPRSAKQEIVLERTDRSGASRRLEAAALWKRDAENRSRFLVRIEAPPDERDAAF